MLKRNPEKQGLDCSQIESQPGHSMKQESLNGKSLKPCEFA